MCMYVYLYMYLYMYTHLHARIACIAFVPSGRARRDRV